MHPFRIAGLVLGILALFFVGFLVVGFLLPSGWHAERSITLDAQPEEVFPYLIRPAGWTTWTPTPESGVEPFGPAEGVGAGHRWDDPSYGTGEFRVTAATPPREVTYEVEVEGGAIRIQGRLLLEGGAGEATLLHWQEEGDFGWNPLLGYLASRMNDLQGAQMEASLANLARVVAGAAVTGGPD